MKKHLKRAFIPHVDNDHLPEVLQRSALLGMTFLILLSFLMSNMQAILWQSSSWLVGAVLPAVIIADTNKERNHEHLGTLTRNTVLDAAAQMKADDMAAKGYFAHYGPGNVAPWYWFDKAGYSYVNAGENLAVHFTDSDAVVTAWMNSPTHRANIVNPNYTEIGVGTAKGTFEGFSTVFVVQLFGTPAATNSPVALAPMLPTPVAASTSTDVTPRVPLRVVASAVSSTVPQSEAVAGIETAKEPASQPLAIAATTTAPTTTVPSTTITRTEIDHDTDTTSLYSDTMATTTNREPAEVSISAYKADSVGVAALATKPSKVLQFIYICIGTVVAFTLLSSLVLAYEHHRPRQILFGVLLLLLMSLLFYVHLMLTASATVL